MQSALTAELPEVQASRDFMVHSSTGMRLIRSYCQSFSSVSRAEGSSCKIEADSVHSEECREIKHKRGNM